MFRNLVHGWLIGLVLLASSARADYIVGVSSGFVPGTAPIVRIDPQTGAYTTITTGCRAYNSLAQSSAGELFGGWFSGSGNQGRVSRFDPATGAILETFNAITPGAGDTRGLSFDANDNLYAVVNRDDNSGSPTLDDDLYRFDLTNETTTVIGSLGFRGVQGFDIAPNGTFFAWDGDDGLLTVDPTTGSATDVNPAIGGTAEIQSIVFAPDGRLFGARRNLYSIDTATGIFTQIGNGSNIDLRGIEYVVPEPSGVSMGLTGLATLVLRVRKRK